MVLRYFNVFGPGQDPNSEYAAVVPKFVTAVLAGERPTINGDGSVSRDFTYVDNVVEANMLAARGRGAAGMTCNVACGARYSLLELLEAIARRPRPARRARSSGRRAPGDILHSQADITRAQRGARLRDDRAVRRGDRPHRRVVPRRRRRRPRLTADRPTAA